MESMLSLFRGFNENSCHFIYKVNFRNKHSSDERTNQGVVFEVHVKLDCLHTKTTA